MMWCSAPYFSHTICELVLIAFRIAMKGTLQIKCVGKTKRTRPCHDSTFSQPALFCHADTFLHPHHTSVFGVFVLSLRSIELFCRLQILEMNRNTSIVRCPRFLIEYWIWNIVWLEIASFKRIQTALFKFQSFTNKMIDSSQHVRYNAHSSVCLPGHDKLLEFARMTQFYLILTL